MNHRFLLIFLLFSAEAFAQTNVQQQADSLYKAKNYKAAAAAYLTAAKEQDYKRKRASNEYNAACCFALNGEKEEAIAALKASFSNGFSDKTNLLADTDLEMLRKDSALWSKLTALIKDKLPVNSNPRKAVFHTEDIHNFWAAYYLYKKDTAHALEIFTKEYFNKASAGTDDYMTMKVSNIAAFVKHLKERPLFYQSIRSNTLLTDRYKKDFLRSFVRLKSLYNDALFPDVYFAMGALTSGGTVSDNGLLLGINQMIKSPEVVMSELTLWQRNNIANVANMKNTVAHEVIHFQQKGMKGDTTVLCYAINEGMADFIGELISGGNSNPRIHIWAKGKEKQIWDLFKEDMYYNRYHNWIANSDKETPDNPADQGYWVGYQICKAYYEQAPDKKQAIYDMLHIQDYKAFLEKSKWEEKLKTL